MMYKHISTKTFKGELKKQYNIHVKLFKLDACMNETFLGYLCFN